MAGVTTLNPEADFDRLRYWAGYPTTQPLDDLACNRIESIVNDRLTPVSAFDTVVVEARPEYVLAVVDGLGVQSAPQEVTNVLGGMLTEYNRTYPDRPNNDAVELDIQHRHVGTIGLAGAEEDLDRAREFLRERGASAPEDVSAAGNDVAPTEAEASTGGGDE